MPTPTRGRYATPAPTATPDAASVKVNADIINVRSGPGTAYPVTGRLDGGATQKIIGKSEDGKWWQIATKEGNGWVAGELVTAGGPMQGVAVVKAAPPPTAAPQAQVAVAAAAPAPRPSGGGSFGYGIQIDPWGDRGAAIGAIKNMGFNWAKFQLPWKDFEGQRGQRNWPDDIIGDLNGNGLNVLVSIVKAPDWARPGSTDRSVEGPPADPATYASFVGEFRRAIAVACRPSKCGTSRTSTTNGVVSRSIQRGMCGCWRPRMARSSAPVRALSWLAAP